MANTNLDLILTGTDIHQAACAGRAAALAARGETA